MNAQPQPEFGSLKQLKHFLTSLRQNHVSTMLHYGSDDGKGFYHQPQRKTASRSSTATCVASLVHAGQWMKESPWWGATSQIAGKLIARPWKSAGLDKDNPF